MLANMASSLVLHKRITTTVAKARELKKYVEPLITKSKTDNTHSRRVVFSYLQDKVAVTELFNVVAAKVGERPGGYTRIIKLGFRLGDAAETVMIELVDFNELYTKDSASKSRTTRRSRKRNTASAEVVAETPAVEAPEVENDSTENSEDQA